MPTGTTPQGYNAASAIAAVQNYSNETTYPAASVILGFLNKGLEEVVRMVGGIKLWAGYPTVQNQTTVQLNDDIQDIESANFSYGSNSTNNTGSASPFTVGAMVNPLEQLDLEAAAGFPNVGFGPPRIFFTYQDFGTAPTQTLAVPPQSVMSQIAGTATSGTVEACVSYVNPSGETTVGPVSDQAITATEQAQMQSPPANQNANGYNIYAGAVGGPYYKQNSTPIALGTPFTIPYPLLAVTAVPGSNTATGAGTGGSLYMQLYPNAMVGQVNVYYRARPLLFADTTASSWTNLDTSVQEAAVVWATIRVLFNRQRADEARSVWMPMLMGPDLKGESGMIGDLRESVARRTVAKSGQVRDVRSGMGATPFWYGR